jgi:putative ABC transport system permease protein
MSWIRGFAERLRVVLRFSRVESELERELRDHFEQEVAAQLQAGVPASEARRRAALRMGNLSVLQEEVRDERGGRLLTDAISDVRIGWRFLRRSPGFALAVVLSLALGTGGTTAIFSVVHAVLLRPLPYADPDRLHEIRVAWGDFSATLSAADFLRLRDLRGNTAAVGAFRLPNSGFTMQTSAGPAVVQGAIVSAELPRVLGVAPVLGRLLSEEPGTAEALISTELWRQELGGSRDVIGRSITLDGNAYTVAGVMPPGYNVPQQSDGAAWVSMPISEPTRRGPFMLRVVARLDPRITEDGAAARLTAAITPVLRDRYRVDPTWRYQLRPLKDVLVGDVRPTLLLLFGAVGLVLLIAVANVANLLLARGATRGRELAVRASLGAGRGRLARQLLAESALLGLMAGALGLAVALLVLGFAGHAARSFVPRLEEVRLDALVIVFALGVGTMAGLLAGVWPALRLPWRHLSDALRDGGRGAGESVRQGRARRLLVASEVALTLIVLTGAALLVKSLIRLQTVDPGFHPNGVLSFRLSLPPDPYDDDARAGAFLDTLGARLRGLPGVSSVAYVTSLPPDRLNWSNNYTIEGTPSESPGVSTVAQWITASQEYFSALGIPITRGRVFSAADGEGTLPVAVVSDTFARRHFPGGEALGKRFKGGDRDSQAPWIAIVGVVGDVPYAQGMWRGVSPTIYLAHAQDPGLQSPYVVIRTPGDPDRLVPAVRKAVLGVDGRVPLRDIASMTQRMHESTAAARFRSLLFSLLGGIALLVAVTGIYGILAYHVNQRRRETAVRRALGASSGHVVGTVIAAGLGLTSAGILAGVAGAFALSRSLSGLLYDVRPSDPGMLGAAAAVVAVAALVACAVPAIRAVRIDPLTILREE